MKKCSLGQKRWTPLAAAGTGEPWSCKLPPTQATSCSPSSLPLGQSLSSANHSLYYGQPLLLLQSYYSCVIFNPPLFNTLGPPRVLLLLAMFPLNIPAGSSSAFSSPLSFVKPPSSFSSSSQVFPSSVSIHYMYPSPLPVPQLRLVYFPYF